MTQPTNLSSIDIAQAQGEGAYIDRQPVEANPYPSGTALAAAWLQGYEEIAGKEIFGG